MSTTHVWPSDDLIQHTIEDEDCVCGPAIEDHQFGHWVIRHYSLDGREARRPYWEHRRPV
jgi:hypothetical protein